LKPDVCRRVVGRLPSPRIQGSLQKPLWFQQRGMAPPFSCFFLAKDADHSGLSCEIVSDLCPNPLSHDWHVQPSCQRPNRGPPERREFSPGEPARVRIRLSSKPYKHTVRRKTRQRPHPTEFPRVFHNGKGGAEWAAGELDEPEAGSSPGFQPDSD